MADWRLTNQDKYLKEEKITFKMYVNRCTKTDHDHCEFCMERFGDSIFDLHQGYCTENDYHWICEKCYEDFKEQFQWIVVDNKTI